MSFNEQPPNPYGGQQPPPQPGSQPGYGPPQDGAPQQPNPYAQPSRPPQPPQGQNPYAQPSQPPQPPQSQNPYAQQPYAQQPGWGGQQMPPPAEPAKKGNASKIIIIAAAAVGVLLVAGGGLTYALMGGSSSSEGTYKLSTPSTVLGGKYTQDTSSKFSSDMNGTQLGSDRGISNATSVTHAWKNGTNEVMLAGAYGNVSNPGAAVSTLLSAADLSSASDQHPSGFDGSVLKCGTKDMGLDTPLPFCAWGDGSTVALTMWLPSVDPSNPDASLSAPTPPSVSDWVSTTVQLRSEVRVKK
jgi:hypothetical protein